MWIAHNHERHQKMIWQPHLFLVEEESGTFPTFILNLVGVMPRLFADGLKLQSVTKQRKVPVCFQTSGIFRPYPRGLAHLCRL